MTGRGFVGAADGEPGRYRGIVSSCLTCGRHCPRSESYCGEHRPIRNVKARGGGTVIARFRAEVLRLSGGRCEAVIDGVRCDVTDAQRLEAHHLRGVAAGGSNDAASNGVCLCKLHHAMIEARKLNVSD